MPIYEYVCEDCGTRYERVVLAKDQPIACPSCASERHTLQFSVCSAPAKSAGANGSDAAPSCGCTPRTCSCN